MNRRVDCQGPVRAAGGLRKLSWPLPAKSGMGLSPDLFSGISKNDKSLKPLRWVALTSPRPLALMRRWSRIATDLSENYLYLCGLGLILQVRYARCLSYTLRVLSLVAVRRRAY